jgi:hypothetical protein
LDIEAVDALIEGLGAYDGGVLMVRASGWGWWAGCAFVLCVLFVITPQ